jgi:hypothetical protein
MSQVIAFLMGIAAGAMLLFFTGCATATISTQHVDGKQVSCDANYTTLFLSMDAVQTSACGLKNSAQIQKVDSAAIGELLKVLVAVP